MNRTVKHVTLQGYSFVGRRDRSDGGLGGEIVAFAVYAFAERIILIQSFDDAERFGPWCTQPNARVLSEFGTGRGLPGDLVTINTFKTELRALEGISLRMIVLGDMNVHNTQWLRHSRANSVEGTALKAACNDAGLKQTITTLTLENHRLDLVFINIPGASASVLPGLTDHKMVNAELTFKIPEQSTVTRMVWQFAKVDRDKTRHMISAKPLENMQTMHAGDAAVLLNNAIRGALHIYKGVARRQSTHLWLTDAVETLVKQTNDAEGTLTNAKPLSNVAQGSLQVSGNTPASAQSSCAV